MPLQSMEKKSSIEKSFRPVDKVEVTSVVDGSIDLLSVIKRSDVQRIWDWVSDRKQAGYPFAEHGFSMLVKTFDKENVHTVLYDAGFDKKIIIENLYRMLIDLKTIDGIVLSHGHMDHTGGLLSVLNAMDSNQVPVFVHERMFLPRCWQDPQDPNSKKVLPPTCPNQKEMEKAGAKVLENKEPRLINDNTILITGEIPRETNFEPGYPDEFVMEDGQWIADPRVLDDRAIVMNVKEKGLVILTGCGHSGVINTVRYVQYLTKIEKVYALIGGLHLAGKYYEPNIPQTVAALSELDLSLLVPSHCTGWLAQKVFAHSFPLAFVPNSVGNKYLI